MTYPQDMFLEQMQWAFKNWQLSYRDPNAPPHALYRWSSKFVHFANELRKLKNNIE